MISSPSSSSSSSSSSYGIMSCVLSSFIQPVSMLMSDFGSNLSETRGRVRFSISCDFCKQFYALVMVHMVFLCSSADSGPSCDMLVLADVASVSSIVSDAVKT